MAEGEGVVSATWDTAKAHPWIVGGSLAALVLLIWYASHSSGSKAQNFTFSYGPTQAETVANDALVASQSHDQASASIAGSYFNYLAASTSSTNGANVAIAGINSTTAMRVADDASNTAISTAAYANNTANTAAAWAADTAITTAGYAMQTTLGQAQLGADVSKYQSALGAQVTEDQIASNERLTGNAQYYAGTIGIMNQQNALASIQSNERITATKMAADFLKGYAP